MPAFIADITQVERGFCSELALHIERPGVDGGNLTFAVYRDHIHREDCAARYQSRGHTVEIRAVKLRSRSQWRVAEAAEIVNVLLHPLVEDAGAGTNGGLAIAERIVGEAEAGAQIVKAMLDAPERQPRAPFLNQSVIG